MDAPNPISTRRATEGDLAAISKLHAHVFGPGRFARTAYRVREGTPHLSRFCRVATRGGSLIAALRVTDVTVGGKSHAVLLGPVAVDPSIRGQGFGRRLVSECIQDMKEAGIELVVLVGDEPYYGRFGFKPVPPGRIHFPGPVAMNRILAAELKEGCLGKFHGHVAASGGHDP